MPQDSTFYARNLASSVNPNELWNKSGLTPNQQYSSGDPLENRIRFYDSYRQRQNSVPGGLINQTLFDTLAGTGNVRLGSGFDQEERESLNLLKNERVKRQALKRQFEIAEKTKAYGQLSYGILGQDENVSPVSDEQIAAVGYAAGGSVAAGAGIGAAALTGTAITGAAGGSAIGAGAAAGIGAGAAIGVAAAPLLLVIAIMMIVQAHQKEQARKKKRKMRTLGAAQGLVANSRGFTPTGALLSREGVMRQERSKSRNSQAD